MATLFPLFLTRENISHISCDLDSITGKTNLFTDMAKIHGAVTIERERCKGCDLCVVACPCGVLALQPKEVNDRGYHFAYPKNEDACIGCAACAMVCPDACIEVYKVIEN